MHAILYVCLRRSEARSSSQARKKVCEYLTREGFDTDLRFSGHCDYFKVGGRGSGRLSLLRLRYEDPKRFDRFWKKYSTTEISSDQAKQLFHETFPAYRGTLPICRDRTGVYGKPDDAQIMDEPLFQQLKRGFSEEEIALSWELNEPNVIFTDDPDDDFQWPRTNEEAAKFWVVVIDYHF
jgi:hypothetical protein